jgi:hypothetical protein
MGKDVRPVVAPIDHVIDRTRKFQPELSRHPRILARRQTPIESDAPWHGCNRPGSASENNVARIDLTPWIAPQVNFCNLTPSD